MRLEELVSQLTEIAETAPYLEVQIEGEGGIWTANFDVYEEGMTLRLEAS